MPNWAFGHQAAAMGWSWPCCSCIYHKKSALVLCDFSFSIVPGYCSWLHYPPVAYINQHVALRDTTGSSASIQGHCPLMLQETNPLQGPRAPGCFLHGRNGPHEDHPGAPSQGCSWSRDAPGRAAVGGGTGEGTRAGPAPFPASLPQNGSREPARLHTLPSNPTEPGYPPLNLGLNPSRHRTEPCAVRRDVEISTAESGRAEPCRGHGQRAAGREAALREVLARDLQSRGHTATGEHHRGQHHRPQTAAQVRAWGILGLAAAPFCSCLT